MRAIPNVGYTPMSILVRTNNSFFMNKRQQNWIKLELYIMSLMLLFLLLIIKSFTVPQNILCWKSWINENYLTILFILLFIVSVLCSIRFFKSLDGTTDVPAEITEIKNGNFEYITFLMSYILPLICFDLSSFKDIIILLILLIILGIIFTKTNLYCLNPIIALAGIKIYIASYKYKGKEFDDIYILSKENLHVGDQINKHTIDSSVVFCEIKKSKSI